MEEREALAWLGRKIGWGLAEGQLDAWSQLGTAAVVDRLVDPDKAGIPARANPFVDIDVGDGRQARAVGEGTLNWIDNVVQTQRPLETFMEFFWSDYFAVSARVIQPRYWIFDHMNLLAEHALGNFADLLQAVSIDPAMLDFLDGRRSTKENPNENFGRELLELYSVGVGNFTEADVKAAARALTGWKVQRRNGSVRLVAFLHDDSPQLLLRVGGVHDLDSVLDAVLSHPATATRVVDKVAKASLGVGSDTEIVIGLAASFADDWELKPVLRRLLELGLAGHSVPTLLEPLAWYVTARRLPTPAPAIPQLREFFTLGGQIPLHPPTVGGFPSPDAYLSTSATIARFNLASHLAERSARDRAGGGAVGLTEDVDLLADRFGLANGFRPATAVALESLEPGIDRLAAALVSPDLVVV